MISLILLLIIALMIHLSILLFVRLLGDRFGNNYLQTLVENCGDDYTFIQTESLV